MHRMHCAKTSGNKLRFSRILVAISTANVFVRPESSASIIESRQFISVYVLRPHRATAPVLAEHAGVHARGHSASAWMAQVSSLRSTRPRTTGPTPTRRNPRAMGITSGGARSGNWGTKKSNLVYYFNNQKSKLLLTTALRSMLAVASVS